jgi:hypothetical protein
MPVVPLIVVKKPVGIGECRAAGVTLSEIQNRNVTCQTANVL